MNRVFIIPILLFLIFLSAVYFLAPKFQEFGILKNEIAEKQAELEKTKEYYADLEQISGELGQYQENLDKINSGLPDEISLPDLLQFFQSKSAERGLLVKSLSQGSLQAEENKIKQTMIELNLIGTLSAIDGFFQDIAKSSRLIDVAKVSLENTKEGLLDFKLSVKVYSY